MRVLTALVVASTLGGGCGGTDSAGSPVEPASMRAASVQSAQEGEANGEAAFDFRHFEGTVLTGSAGALHGLNAGGIPWRVRTARARLTRDGRLRVDVNGLVLAAGPRAGENPIAQFRAVVSCQVESSGGSGYTTVNVPSSPADASPEGYATIDERLTGLPARCLAPAVFVTSPGLAWFIVSG